jgi:NAD(P)-dependent dehydrogenase (short-subunit alcohol dehydrogenase family)
MRKAIAVALAVVLATCLDVTLSAKAGLADEQKAVLITGASSGIGRIATERLAGSGYFVYAGARKQSDIDALNEIENVKAVRLDVTIQEDIDAAVELIESQGRGLWGVVNNAGVNVIEPLIEADESELEFIFDVNVFGVFRVTKAFAPMIIDSGGRIVNISSIAGILSGGFNGYGGYVMSKHAVEAFTDQLAWELGPLGVSVSAIEPGNFSTQIGVSRCKRMLANLGAKKYRYFAEDMQRYLSNCRERLDSKEPLSSPAPLPVAEAIEHALFAESPKEHYLVVSDPIEAQITIGKAFEELLHLNHDHPDSYSREELIKMMDSESAIVRGEKPRGIPGEI